MLRISVVSVVILTLAAFAFAQDGDPASAPAVSANQPLADAVKQAVDAKDVATALTKARQLEESESRDEVWAANTGRVPRLLWDTGKRQDALDWLKARATSFAGDSDGLSAKLASTRCNELCRTCRQLALLAVDPNMRVELAAAALGLRPEGAGDFSLYFDSLVVAKKYDDALRSCLDYADKASPMAAMRARRLALMAKVGKGEDALRAEAKELLKVADDPTQALKALTYLLPGNDVALCCGQTAQQVLDGYKALLRRQNAKLNTDALVRLASQLTKGGNDKLLAVSEQAKALAVDIKDAPLAGFLVPLLTGDHAAAFREAFNRAKAAGSDLYYIGWVNAAAGALRCKEQHYNGTALEFVKFINGERPDSPVSQLAGE